MIKKIIEADINYIIKEINYKKFKNKKILITGCNGLLGKYLTIFFCIINQKYNNNNKIYIISKNKLSKDIKIYKDKNLIFFKKDLSKKFNFKKKVDFIFHAACYGQPGKWIENKINTINLNVFTTKTLLDIAKINNARFIFFSSLDIYGKITKYQIPIKEEYEGLLNSTSSLAAYGESKRLGETLCSIYRNDFKLKIYIARVFHTYGPGITASDKRVIADFIKMALFKRKIKLFDLGKDIKQFGYIRDIILKILNIILFGKSLVYNVAGKSTLSILKLAKIIAKELNINKIIISKNNYSKKYISKINKIIKANTTKYDREFGVMKEMNMENGIKNIIKTFR